MLLRILATYVTLCKQQNFLQDPGAHLKFLSEEGINGTCRCKGIALSFLEMPSLAIEAEE